MLTIAVLTILLGGAFGDVNEKARLSRERVNSDYPGLEAPFQSPAQAISVRHDPSADLCKDPFHSFLCSPVGGRRSRIDGNLRPGALLPPGLRGQDEQQPLESGSALLPAHLPPSQYLPSGPSRFYLPGVPTSTRPPFPDPVDTFETRTSPEIIRPPSNAYLPIGNEPLGTNINPILLPKQPSRSYLPLDEPNVTGESTNIEGSALLPASISKDSSKHDESHTLERLCNDPFHSFLCKPLKPRKRIDGKIRPGAKIPPNVLVGASSIRRESKVLPLETGSALLPSSISQPSRNYLPSESSKPAGSYNYQTTTTPRPFNQFSTNKPISGYQYPSSSGSVPSGIPSSQGTYSYSRPANAFSYPSTGNPFPTQTPPQTAKPVLNQQSYEYQTPVTNVNYPTSTTSGYTFPTTTLRPIINNVTPSATNIQQHYFQPSSQNGYQYNKPTTQFIYTTSRPAYQTLATTTTPSTIHTNIYQTTHHIPEVNNVYPYPTNIQQSFVKPTNNGYNYPKPAIEFPSPTTTPRPNPFQSNIGQYPLPSNIQENAIRPHQNGYSYPKPSLPFNYQTSTSPTTTFQTPIYYPKPTNIQENILKPNVQNGYNYPKPSVPFTTTIRPVSYYPNPSNIQQNFVRPNGNNGYNYNKPSSTYTIKPPTTYRPPTFPTTTIAPTTIRPFQYFPSAKPTNVVQNVVRPSQNGYQYQKPSTVPVYTYNPIAYPTTSKPYNEQTIKPFQQYQPTNIQQNVVKPGYTYNKPSIPFTTGTTKRPTTFFIQPTTFHTTKRPVVYQSTSYPSPQEYYQPKPTNIQQSIAKPIAQNGYVYQKPSVPFTYGSTKKPNPTTTVRPTFQTTFKPVVYQSTSLPSEQNYLYQRPTNIHESVAKPSSQNGYVYPKPSINFNYDTTNKPTTFKPTFQTSRPVVYQSTSRPLVQDHHDQKPTNIQQNFARPHEQNSYSYNKPQTPFTSTYRPTTYQTTTYRPQTFQTSTYKPTTFPTSTYSSTSYQTTTYKPTIYQTTEKPDYHYPNPSNVQQNIVQPTHQNGYNYQKPSIPFTNPTTTRRPTFYTTTNQPTTFQTTTGSYPYPKPSNIQQNVVKPVSDGYHYNKPSKPLMTYSPQSNPFPNPTNVQESVASPPQSGYLYNRPAKPFDLPSESQYQPVQNTLNGFPSQSYGNSLSRQLQFGDRINPNLSSKSDSHNHDDEFLPLRNFEII